MRVTIHAPGLTVSTDGPIEAADAIQRDAFEVRLPPTTPETLEEDARILADWIRRQRIRKAG